MNQITVGIDGMSCGMCEAHINDTIRRLYPKAKKVSSSYKKKETKFLLDEEIHEEDLRAAIDKTGYTFLSMDVSEYQKRKLFGKR